jgi:hypothetical protein
MNSLMALAYSIVSSLVIIIPVKIIEKIFSCESSCLKFFGYLIFSSILLVCYYVSFTIAALIGVEKANEWAVNYSTSFSLDFFVFNPLTGYFLVSLYYFTEQKSNCCSTALNKILKKVIDSAKLDEEF